MLGNCRLKPALTLILLLRLNGGTTGQLDKPSRTASYDITNLKCQIGIKQPEDEQPLSFQDFEYWYAMGTQSTVDAIQMFNLEQFLYNKVEDDMVWCWEELDDTSVAAAQTEQHGGRRDLLQKQWKSLSTRRRLSASDPRNLNIITFTPGNTDRQTLHRCPDILEELVNATSAKQCTVVAGSMRIIAHANEDVHYAIAALRDGLQKVMNVDKIGQHNELPNIKFLTYLGDSEDDVLALITGGRPGDVVGGDGSDHWGENAQGSSTSGDGVRGDETEGGNMALDGQESQSSSKGDKKTIVAVAIGVPVALVLLAAAFLQKNKRTIVSATSYYDVQEADHILIGTGDPPGSYHEGLFHFLPNGQDYLSTNCEFCHVTRKDFQYITEISQSIESQKTTDRDLATILEDEPYTKSLSYDNDILCRADSSRGLGQHHLGIDVHNCSSATCKICKNSKRPIFLSRSDPRDAQIDEILAKCEECGEV